MPNPPKADSKSKSWLVQFRLNENNPTAKAVLDILCNFNDRGYSDADVIVESLLEFHNQDFPKRTSLDNLAARIEEMNDAITDNQGQLYDMIVAMVQRGDLADFTNDDGQTAEEFIGERVSDQAKNSMLSGLQGKEFD